MAITPNAVWEVRTTATASNVNGGFYKTGASGTDYSQQNAAQYALSSLTSAGAGAVILTASAATDMVGNGINIASGTNFTVGWYEITAVSAGVSITVDRNCTTGVGASGVAKVGGAMSLGSSDDAVFEAMVAGNIMYVKQGTYTLGGTVNIAVAGTTTGSAPSYIRVEGYASSRGDRPVGSTRPIFDCGANTFTYTGSYWLTRNMQFTGTATPVIDSTSGAIIMLECKITNTSTTSGRIAAQIGANGHLDQCELISYRGTAFNGNGEAQMLGCYIHDSNIGATLPSTTGGSHIINCIFDSCVTSCVQVNAISTLNNIFMGNIFFGGTTNKTGIGLNLSSANTTMVWLINNIFYGFVTAVTSGNTVGNTLINTDDYNCYNFNTTNATNWTLGAHSITTQPTFANVGQVVGSTATTSSGVLTQAGGTFSASGVVAGRDFIYIISGTGITAGVYPITVVGTTTLTLGIAPADNATNNTTYQITTGRNFATTSTNVGAAGWPVMPAALTTSYTDIGVQKQYGLGSATSTDPGIANVRSSTGYNINGSSLTGTAAIPTAANVRSGTATDATTGSLAVPAAASVLNGVSVDATTGTYVTVAASNVKSGVAFGAASALTGTLVSGSGGSLSPGGFN